MTAGSTARAGGVTTDEVVSNLLGAVADEMLAGLVRAAYSPNIKERADASASVFDAGGQTVAIASSAPLHLGALSGLVAAIRERICADGVEAGDVWVGNDPYECGGTHLNDIAVVTPVVDGGEVVAYLANLAHHADVGGRTPGSESGDNTSIFQDGLRLPAMKLADAGRLRQDVVSLILLNSRTPEERRGDLRAQLASLHAGRERFGEILARYGAAPPRTSSTTTVSGAGRSASPSPVTASTSTSATRTRSCRAGRTCRRAGSARRCSTRSRRWSIPISVYYACE